MAPRALISPLKGDNRMYDYQKIAADILSMAESLGSDETEIYFEKSESMSLKVKNSTITETNTAQSIGYGIRVIKNHRQGYAYSADFSPRALQSTLKYALLYANYSDPDNYLSLPKKQNYPHVNIYDENIAKTPLSAKIDLACQSEKAILNCDYIISVEHSSYQEASSETHLYNSHGLAAYEKASYCALAATALAEKNGEQNNGSGFCQSTTLSELDPALCANMTAKRTTQLLNAQSMLSANCSIVLDPYITCQFLELLAPSFSGENVLKNKSMYATSLGAQITSPDFTLLDDSTINQHIGSASFDGEGTAAQKTEIITAGVLSHYLYDTKSAVQAKSTATANALRSSYKTPPHLSTTNYYLAPGRYSTKDIISVTNYGVYITDILGAHTANTLTGDFSLGASGILIENGKLTHPVRGITIAGNLKELLLNIDMIADDLTFFGAEGAPTIRIKNVPVSA